MFNKLSGKGEFTKNAFILTLGTSIAQIIPMIFYPIIGRIFTPAQFGVLEILGSITSILVVLATGKYESSILITKTKKEAANIIGLILFLSSIVLSISLIILLVFEKQFSELFHNQELSKWLFVPPILAFVIIIFNTYNEWCVRNKYFVYLSWNKISNTTANTLSKLFFGLIKITSNGLIVGELIGRSISAGTCIYRALKKDKREFLQISFKQIRISAKKYIEFPKYIMPDQLLSQIGGALPILFIGFYFNSVEVGFYGMTLMVLTAPMNIISSSVRDVFRQRANEDYMKYGNCITIYKRLFKNLSLIGLIGLFGLFFILPNLFSIVLGKQWQISGVYSQILLPMIILSFISMSMSGVLIITGKMKISMYWQIYYVVITLIALLIGVYLFNSVLMTLLCLTIGRGSAYIIYIILSYKYSKGTPLL